MELDTFLITWLTLATSLDSFTNTNSFYYVYELPKVCLILLYAYEVNYHDCFS